MVNKEDNNTIQYNTILFCVSILFIVFGTALMLFIPQILNVLPDFLENYVFHRTFNHEAFRDTMVSLVAYPIFFAILLDAIFFAKFSDKQKIVILVLYAISILYSLFFTSCFYTNDFVGLDLSSETLFGYECFREKTFWPTTWFYSMEFRFLNTQLLTAPLFIFTKNLSLVRAITAVLCELVLFAGTYFILHSLRIKKLWLKLLCCTLMISPVSWTYFCYVQYGSYYIPHIVFSFFYVGLFISLIFHSEEHSEKKQKILFGIFVILAFLSGVSSIRYILNFTFPVWAVICSMKFYELRKKEILFNLKEFFVLDKATFVSTTGLFVSGIGYIFNSAVIASIFTFKNMNKIRFNPLGKMDLDSIKDMIFRTAGFNDDVSVFTPAGIANVLLFAVFVFTIMLCILLFRSNLSKDRRFFMQFLVFSVAFSLYTNICTEMVERYLTMLFCFFIPLFAIVIEQKDIGTVKKWCFSVSSAVLIMTNAYLCFGRMQLKEESLELGGVCEFLKANNYEFGYALSDIANPIWFWSNGSVEVAALDADSNANNVDVIPTKYAIHKWLEPKKFLDKNYYKGDKHIFFAIEQRNYNASKNKAPLEKGTLVFSDKNYLVFDYDSPNSFISAFE
jgi:hypothetical protein